MTAPLPEWAELVAGFAETFGSGVRITRLRLKSVPGYELVNRREENAQRGLTRETYEHNMPGFGPPLEEHEAAQLPKGWRRLGDVPRETQNQLNIVE